MTETKHNSLLNPFKKAARVLIEDLQNGYFTIKSITSTGLIQPPEKLSKQLFFKYEPNFYGLHAKYGDKHIQLSTVELIEIFTPTYSNPYFQIKGVDDASEAILNRVNELAPMYVNGEFWQEATFIDGHLNLHLGPHGQMMEQAVEQKLAQLNIQGSALQSLIPYFKDGGWPLTTVEAIDGIQFALRLSEPDDVSTEWILETVIINNKTGTIWTPSEKKRALPISIVMPDKWQHLIGHAEKMQMQLLKLLQSAQESSQSIYDSLNATEFIHVALQDADVRIFLQAHLNLLQAIGLEVILPSWLKELKQSKMKVRVNAASSNSKSVASLDDILTFKWEFSMNDVNMNAEDFQRLVNEKREFVRFGDEWFKIDAQWLEQMKQLMEQAENENWTVRELVFKDLPESLVATFEEDEDDALRDDPMFAFNIQQSLKAYVEQLSEKKQLPSVKTPDSLQAELRPYQQDGFEWLSFMRQQGFGACLADDMGLGKTVQLITYLLHTIEANLSNKPSLIICPTSVLGNWQKEIERFAPKLRVHTHYSSSRLKDEAFTTLMAETNEERPHIVLTTYGTTTQDEAFLQQVNWNIIGLDEAQNIKNMQTMQSRSIRKLQGEHHIALTGTPVENRLSELWAIFDFIHKGYLGSFGKFQEKYILPIERDESEKHKQSLRMKIRPFLLRRTKRDPDLQLNLPEKLESNEFCPLTTEQAALYESYIQDTMSGLEQMSAFEKRGHILKMLNKLKQLCNHPALYLKEPFTSASDMLKRSVKLNRLVSMSYEIVQNGEQCLIFTQYIGMGNLLQHCFSELYDIDVPFLTGSMPKQQRDRLVEAFQAGEFPIFILSLKAGGTGLNLTAANHVMHADRWWNPAVENQATDRAYRIGQKQFVQVHKFVTIGTVEEKINKMLEMKSALSEELIQSSNWITELKDEELKELLILD